MQMVRRVETNISDESRDQGPSRRRFLQQLGIGVTGSAAIITTSLPVRTLAQAVVGPDTTPDGCECPPFTSGETGEVDGVPSATFEYDHENSLLRIYRANPERQVDEIMAVQVEPNFVRDLGGPQHLGGLHLREDLPRLRWNDDGTFCVEFRGELVRDTKTGQFSVAPDSETQHIEDVNQHCTGFNHVRRWNPEGDSRPEFTMDGRVIGRLESYTFPSEHCENDRQPADAAPLTEEINPFGGVPHLPHVIEREPAEADGDAIQLQQFFRQVYDELQI